MKFWPVLLLCLVIAGCSRATSDNVVSFDNSQRIQLQDKAVTGDAEAQYALGNSYCCGENGFWDTKQAIHWWCEAANHGHAAAKAKLEALKTECPAASPAQ